MTFFSIVVPTYNRAGLIERTLNSIFLQKFQNYEIIVIDDGSTDNTEVVLKPFLSKIIYLKQDNTGPGAARNRGIGIAQGQYIAFLDSDDLWFPWSLKIYYEVIQQADYPIFLAGNSIFFKDEGDLRLVEPSSLKFQYFSDYYASSKQPLWLGVCSVAIQTNYLKKIGGFSNHRMNAEDSDLWLRLGCGKGFIFIDTPILFAYRQHSNTAIFDQIKTYHGIHYMIQQEKSGQYPGDKKRKRERLVILTRHVRPISLACLRQGNVSYAWTLYAQTWWWHFTLFRVRYLLFFPVLLMVKLFQKKLTFNHGY